MEYLVRLKRVTRRVEYAQVRVEADDIDDAQEAALDNADNVTGWDGTEDCDYGIEHSFLVTPTGNPDISVDREFEGDYHVD